MDITPAEFWATVALAWVLGMALGFMLGRVFRCEHPPEPIVSLNDPATRRAFEESRRAAAQRQRPPVILHRQPYDHRDEDDPA